MRVLIVDDSSFMRDYMTDLLRRMGCMCLQAKNGFQALEMLAVESPFDLMLLDLNMPVMNGMQCVKVLRLVKSHTSMKIMMVTTETEDAIIAKAFDNGADEFLAKPFTPEGLREKMLSMGLAA